MASKLNLNDEDPCIRLYYSPTLAALRKFDLESSFTDSLDFRMAATLNQYADWPITKKDSVRQPLTLRRKCICRPLEFSEKRPFDHPLRTAPFYGNIEHYYHIKLAIECPHSSQSNNGYSRKKENGNFYRS
ncbi:cilia- and flagella-associated protein 276 isoform X2 [Parasteatoda tepidariorum]|uniref:cilia- and flagella-associated protein 276 isoform X2 n=1 Tax=Parasteatoda tepidariorum TaxID=114398 RepID=UPI0039BCEE4D